MVKSKAAVQSPLQRAIFSRESVRALTSGAEKGAR
ncbi:hypothetical protein ABIA25_002534 [Sinorhizobium fredii]